MKEKILFLNAPIWNLQSIPHRAVRSTAPPLLISILRKSGHEAIFIDADALNWTWTEIKTTIEEMKPTVIAFTSFYNNRYSLLNLIKLIKHDFPDIKIISGGPFATTNPDILLRGGCDGVCIGEGELVIEKMLNKTGKIIGKQVDLNSMPFPSYESCFPEESYYNGAGPYFEKPESWLLITRGCRHRCSFCSNPLFSGQIPRLMNSDRVYEELSLIKSRDIKHVYFYSDELVGSSLIEDKWLEKVCEKISSIGLTYKTQGRCNRKLQESTLQAMKEAGFKAVGWGIESMSPKILKLLHKGIEPEDVWNTLRLSKKVGLYNWVFIMVGCLDETNEDFEMTRTELIKMKKEGLIDKGQVSIMILEPGAPLWEKAFTEGWVEDKQFNSPHFEPCLNVPWASKEEISKRKNILWDIING